MSKMLFLFDEEGVEKSSSENIAMPEQEKASVPASDIRNSLLTALGEGRWKPEKQYYQISEVAHLFGMNVSHVRFWTNEFGLKVRQTKKGDRLYNYDNILQLKEIYRLIKEEGFTLQGAKTQLKSAVLSVADKTQLILTLENFRQQLKAIRAAL